MCKYSIYCIKYKPHVMTRRSSYVSRTLLPSHAYTHVHSSFSVQDREKEIKNASGGGTNWCNFITALSKLAHAESAYYNLSYMERSWSDSWRRKREVG